MKKFYVTLPDKLIDTILVTDVGNPYHIDYHTDVLLPEVIEWCTQNLQNKHRLLLSNGSTGFGNTVEFTLEIDAIYFKLRWMG